MPRFKTVIINEEIDNMAMEQLCEAMSGQDIADSLGVTRQYVSQVLKKSMEKIYKIVLNDDGEGSPFKTAVLMMQMLKVGDEDQEVKDFFKMFPPKVRKEIEEDGKNYLKKGGKKVVD